MTHSDALALEAFDSEHGLCTLTRKGLEQVARNMGLNRGGSRLLLVARMRHSYQRTLGHQRLTTTHEHRVSY